MSDPGEGAPNDGHQLFRTCATFSFSPTVVALIIGGLIGHASGLLGGVIWARVSPPVPTSPVGPSAKVA
ncbi:MAG: hypothetical protein M3Y71_12420 [Actinomycetota bacterium]|nr:hypothetical protein [Actinomycetota bacterium]